MLNKIQRVVMCMFFCTLICSFFAFPFPLQVEAQRQAKESAAAAVEQERAERIRLEALRQKSCTQQSAVASPEVKRHLQVLYIIQ